MGVLHGFTTQSREFQSDEIEFLRDFADQAAVALENARLFHEAEERATNLEVLVEITKTVNAALDLNDLFRVTVEQVKRVIPCERCSVYEVDPGQRVISRIYVVDEVEERANRISPSSLKGTEFEHVLEIKKARNIPDTRKDPHPRIQLLAAEGLRSIVNVPILSGGGCIGFLNIASEKADAFAMEQINLLGSVADHLAPAMKNAELYARAKQSGKRLDNFVRSASDGIITVDLEGRITSWNPGAEAMCGCPEKGMLGQDFLRVFPQAAREERERWASMKSGKTVPPFEAVRRRKDGTRVDISLTLSPIQNAEGRLVGISGIQRDITARKGAEEALRNSEARNRAILEAAPDGIITFDENGAIGSFNPAAERIFDLSAPDALGGKIGTLMDSADARRFAAYLRWYLQTGENEVFSLSREVSGRRKDGATFPMNMTVSEVRLEGRRIFTGIIRDLTAHKAIEDRIHQAERMESTGILARGIAHDFGNLLTSIQANLMLALTEMKPANPGFIHLSRLSQAANRAAELVTRLRALGRDLPIQKRRVNLNMELQTVRDLLPAIIPDSIEVEIQPCREICTTQADPVFLQDMLMNLCLNAKDAMPEGGRLSIRIERLLLEAGHPDLGRDMAPGAYDCISVHDSGKGMTQDVRDKIFEPFFTTKGSSKGTGLGLPMVQRIVKEHNGFISI